MNDILLSPINLHDFELLIKKQIQKAISETKVPSLTKEPTKWYSLQEAAKYCKMAVATFRIYLKKRKVSGSKPGKNWIFTQNDLDKFLQKYRQKTIDEIEDESSAYLKKRKGGNR